ncbi:MAG: DUF1415 domain-containing protein [Spongiibacteraceae bacterium]
MSEQQLVEQSVRNWLQETVVGLDLCPFAGHVVSGGQLRIVVSEADSEEALLEELYREITLLEITPCSTIETSLIAAPKLFDDFLDYNDYLAVVDGLLEQQDWSGVFQIASFHPDYCFADSTTGDPANFSNRSPYPLFHILREQSVERALQSHSNPEEIPERNIALLRNLPADELKRLYPHCF